MTQRITNLAQSELGVKGISCFLAMLQGLEARRCSIASAFIDRDLAGHGVYGVPVNFVTGPGRLPPAGSTHPVMVPSAKC